MLTKTQAARLRGLIARHSRCQWNMGATAGGRGAVGRSSAILIDDANKAREALFAEIRALTEPKHRTEEEQNESA